MSRPRGNDGEIQSDQEKWYARLANILCRVQRLRIASNTTLVVGMLGIRTGASHGPRQSDNVCHCPDDRNARRC